MTGRDFLPLARRLAGGSSEAEWRTAVSRAYYAAFHAARQVLENLGFDVPFEERAHKYLAFRLTNCGEPSVQAIGIDLDKLRQDRNRADYDFRSTVRQPVVMVRVQLAEQILGILDGLDSTLATQIRDAMIVYERDVLQEVTWHP